MDKKKLEYFYNFINETVLHKQDPITGLIPIYVTNSHAWVRDNTYAVLSVWGLALAYRKVPDVDEDRARRYELEKSVVQLMRGLLTCYMRQADKVERFKHTQHPLDSLHAKFNSHNCKPVVGDSEWGHLQIDAVSIYLLTLAQITASGIRVIWTKEEVAFIQNLIFYIELAYRIPDYGIWERGDKSNQGLPELNSSSVGLARAALEAMNNLDLFGAHGGTHSTIHVLADESQQCHAVLQSMLPRESNSKEADAALLGIVGYPAFAVDDEEVVDQTRKTILSKLEGQYGCKRFLRDGFRSPREDPTRLHYEPWELRMFENIECEWPLFYAYVALSALFNEDKDTAGKYLAKLKAISITQESEFELIPESYTVASDRMDLEAKLPGSQRRIPVGKVPHIWSQSLYILAKMIYDGVLLTGEIDPLGRRLVTEPKPDLVVQVAIVAENTHIKARLHHYGMDVQTFWELADSTQIQVYPAKILNLIYGDLGKLSVLNLTGRTTREVGILATSKLYMVGSRKVAFTPQFLDHRAFYLSLDVEFLLDTLRTDVAFIGRAWTSSGRPLFIIPIYEWFFGSGDDSNVQPALISTIKKLQSGYLNGTRVRLGKLADFVSTSCITKLSFVESASKVLDRSKPVTQSTYRRRLASHHSDTSIPASGHAAMNTARSLRRPSVALTSAVAFDLAGSDNDGETVGRKLSSNNSLLLDGELPDFPDDDFDDSLQLTSSVHHLKSPINHLTDSNENLSSSVFQRRLLNSCAGALDHLTDQSYAGVSTPELLVRLQTTEDIFEQVDLLHQLCSIKGLDWDTQMDSIECSVRDLLKEVYERAGQLTQWWLVRFTSGLLGKRVEHLAKALTDILVQQKQVTVGLPPEPRERVIDRPLPPDELSELIHLACGQDFSMVMLTQEILVYLSMFARAEPQLLDQMLRLRVGLIIQVMASELGRTLHCSGEDASMHLYNLSPFETKTLLHHILSGTEFKIISLGPEIPGGMPRVRVARNSAVDVRSPKTSVGHRSSIVQGVNPKGYRIVNSADRRERRRFSVTPRGSISAPRTRKMSLASRDDNSEMSYDTMPDVEEEEDRHGYWVRRRKIDGALNRVPPRFYERLWKVLERAPHGMSICQLHLSQNLTKEMTPGENKFAMVVEGVMNRVPIPEFRQLLVEAISVLSGVVEADRESRLSFQQTIPVMEIVYKANMLFLEDQKVNSGAALFCCATVPGRRRSQTLCRSANALCIHFYDTAPSGRFGTLTYMMRALALVIPVPINEEGNLPLECSIQ